MKMVTNTTGSASVKLLQKDALWQHFFSPYNAPQLSSLLADQCNLGASSTPMEYPYLPVAATVIGFLGLWGLYALAVSGGNLSRYFEARRLAHRWLRDPDFAAKVTSLDQPPPPAKPSAEPVRILALLQREGRLIDFLLEDIQSYANDQIGAAVRDIHRGCRKTLEDHLELEPVLEAPEASDVEIPAGFDPSAVRLTGNVTGTPPFKGTLRHHGWRVKEIKLAPPPEGQDQFVLQPAEVELP